MRNGHAICVTLFVVKKLNSSVGEVADAPSFTSSFSVSSLRSASAVFNASHRLACGAASANRAAGRSVATGSCGRKYGGGGVYGDCRRCLGCSER